MQNKTSKNLDFSGHNVYVGLDVHAASWAVNILVDEIEHRNFTQPPNPDILSNYLHTHFPGADYYSAYECGFCGYHHHRRLLELGINNIVINPADLPVTNKEKINKKDPVDSRRISRALRNKQLKGIHIFNPKHEQFRSLNRMRCKAAKEHRRVKNRIRSFLYYYGIEIPSELNPEYWTLAFVNWLKQLQLPNQTGTFSLVYLMDSYQDTKNQLLKVSRHLRHQVKLHYPVVYKHLMTVPGIGPINAMCLIAEIGDISRFKSCKHLASFVGLVPRSHQSGQKDPNCSLTYRSNKYLRTALVESAWMALRADPALLKYYKERITKNKSQVVIIKVAHKVLNRIRYVWLTGNTYQKGTV
jgi:transposase